MLITEEPGIASLHCSASLEGAGSSNVVLAAKMRKLNNLRKKSDRAKITLAVSLRCCAQSHSLCALLEKETVSEAEVRRSPAKCIAELFQAGRRLPAESCTTHR